MKGPFRRGSRSSYQLVLVAGATAGMVVAGGLITARAGSDEIHACRNKGSGIVRVVDAPGSCNGSEIAMSWNAQGPAGRDGRDGVDGKDGRDGGAGGAATIDQLVGRPCNVGSSNEGTLAVAYGTDGVNDPVTFSCHRNVEERVLTTRLWSSSAYYPPNGGKYVNAGGVVTSEPAGLTCTFDGSPTPTWVYGPDPISCVGDFLPGTEVVLSAVPDEPYPGYAWRVHFGSACTLVSETSCKLTITKNMLLDVTFRV